MAGTNDSPSKPPEEQQLEKSPQRFPAFATSQIRVGDPEPPPSPNPGSSPPLNLQAILVGGSASDAAGGVGGLDMAAASRKRAREAHEGLGIVVAEGADDQLPFQCTVCRKGCHTDKSLIDHMRTHSGRSWKVTFPPPVFSGEEFAHMGLLNPERGEERPSEQEDEQAGQEATRADAREVAADTQEAIDPNESQPEAAGRIQYRIPDLNLSPPPNWDRNCNGNSSDQH